MLWTNLPTNGLSTWLVRPSKVTQGHPKCHGSIERLRFPERDSHTDEQNSYINIALLSWRLTKYKLKRYPTWCLLSYYNIHQPTYMYWLKKTEKNGNENNTWQAKVITEVTLWEFEIEMHSPLPIALYGDWSHCVWTATSHHRPVSLTNNTVCTSTYSQRTVGANWQAAEA